jgi:hypothetical protein
LRAEGLGTGAAVGDVQGSGPHDAVVIASVDALVSLVTSSPRPVYVRFSAGPERDGSDCSVDHESGLRLPGLSVNPLHPPSWWRDRTLTEWVCRQITTYRHLEERDGDRRCWVVTGTIVERGPDNEPLLADVDTVGLVSDEVVEECRRRTGGSSDDERVPPWQSQPG